MSEKLNRPESDAVRLWNTRAKPTHEEIHEMARAALHALTSCGCGACHEREKDICTALLRHLGIDEHCSGEEESDE